MYRSYIKMLPSGETEWRVYKNSQYDLRNSSINLNLFQNKKNIFLKITKTHIQQRPSPKAETRYWLHRPLRVCIKSYCLKEEVSKHPGPWQKQKEIVYLNHWLRISGAGAPENMWTSAPGGSDVALGLGTWYPAQHFSDLTTQGISWGSC